jgi:hypothetical protein
MSITCTEVINSKSTIMQQWGLESTAQNSPPHHITQYTGCGVKYTLTHPLIVGPLPFVPITVTIVHKIRRKSQINVEDSYFNHKMSISESVYLWKQSSLLDIQWHKVRRSIVGLSPHITEGICRVTLSYRFQTECHSVSSMQSLFNI